MFFRNGMARLKAWGLVAFFVVRALHSVHAQTATNDFYLTQQGSVLNVAAPGILTNDTGGTLSAILVNGPVNGTLTLQTNGAFAYAPTNNFTGVDGFTYRASNGSLTSNVASVIIMVQAPGELFHDNFSRPTNGGPILPWVQETTTNVLHTGPQGSVGVLGVWNVSNRVMNATCPPNCYGYDYYPSAGWTNYSVQAQIQFSSANAASAGILGRLNGVTGAHYAAWIYPENSTEQYSPHNGKAVLLLIKYSNWTIYTVFGYTNTLPGVGTNWHTVKLGFQANTISCYYDNLLLTNITDNGSLDGQPAYTNGGVGFNMWTLASNPYLFSVSNVIVSANVVSVANNDSYNAATNSSLQVSAPGILANDSGNGPLTAILVSNPAGGSLTLTNNGGFSYTPTNGFTGVDNFTYKCTDGLTTSGVATVFITASNSPPVANNNTYTNAENTTLRVGAPGVLANDTGGSGPLTALLVSGPANGPLALTNNGGFTYQSTNSFTGVDVFNYKATDGQSTSAVATAAIIVVPPGGLFNDNFARPTNYNSIFPWTLQLATAVPALDPAPSGTWTITNNTFIGASTAYYTYTSAYYNNPNWTNFSVQAQLQVSTTNGVGAGLGGRLNPATGARYIAWMYPENSPDGSMNGLAAMAICKYKNWTNYTGGNFIRLPSVGTSQHTVKLTFQGSAVLAYFDGTLVTNWTDDGFFDGQPALTSGGIDVETSEKPSVPYTSTVKNVAVTVLPVTNVLTVAVNGTNRLYGATNPVFTVSYSGFVNGDTISVLSGAPVLTTGATTNSPAGAYAITNSPGTLSATNYALSFTNGTLTINPAALAITASNWSKTYGQTVVFAGTEFSAGGLLNHDTATGVNLTCAGAAAGASLTGSPYSIVPTNAAGTGLTNYAINYVNGQLTVSAAALTVTANSTNRIYGLANPAFTASYTGFVNGDTVAVLSGSPSLTTTATSASPVAVYSIVATNGTLTATNYGFNFVNGTLTVTAAPKPAILSVGLTNRVITVSWSSVAGSTYGLQYATNLIGANWIFISPNVTAASSTASQTDLIGSLSWKFYRAALVPQ